MRDIYYILFLFMLFFSCKNNNQVLVGLWELEGNPQYQLEFTKDGYFNQYIANKKQLFEFLEEKNGKTIEVDYGNMTYQMKHKKDSIWVHLIGEKNNKQFAKQLYFVDNNHLTLVTYKEGKDIDDHIQTVSSYHRIDALSNNFINKSHEKTLSLILNQDIASTKEIYIAYGQPNGIAPKTDSLGNIVLEVPKSGILKTKFVEDVNIISKGRIKAYYKNENTQTLEEIKVIQLNQSIKFGEKIKDNHFLQDSIMVFVERFNPSRDRVVNKVFGEEIEGNVQTFMITSPKNRYLSN